MGDPFEEAAEKAEQRDRDEYVAKFRMGNIPLTDQPPKLLTVFGSSELITMLWGDGGSGKSVLLLAMAVSLAEGIEVIPGLPPATIPLKVLYLDYEDRRDINRRRLDRMVSAAPENLFYYRPKDSLLSPEGQVEVRGIVEALGIDVVFIDSVAFAARVEDIIAPQSAIDFKEACQGLGVPVVSLFHVPKETTLDNPYGSIFWKNVIIEGWSIEKMEGTADVPVKGHVIVLENQKDNDGPPQEPLALRIVWGGYDPATGAITSDITFTKEDAATYAKERSRKKGERNELEKAIRGQMRAAILVHVMDVGKHYKKADIRRLATATLQSWGVGPQSDSTWQREFSEMTNEGLINTTRMEVWIEKKPTLGTMVKGPWAE